jgi:hypothetical protein
MEKASKVSKKAVAPGIVPNVAQEHHAHHLGLLLPITSKQPDLWLNLAEFLSSFVRTTKSKQQQQTESSWKFSFFLGFDRNLGDEEKQQRVVKLFNDALSQAKIDFAIHTRQLRHPDGHICWIWRDLAQLAKEQGECGFFALLRDDIKFKSEGWANAILNGFRELSEKSKQPFGFGCVALLDESFPAFPTFPVVHRTHFEIFPEEIFPSSFSSHSAEAFVFELYFRYGCAKISPTARVVRQPTLRTEEDARKRSLLLTEYLAHALGQCASWLRQAGHVENSKHFLGFDIVVPSFRATKDVLERILSLPTPEKCACRFTIVCDNPDSKVAIKVFQDLESDHEHDAHVRIRMNAVNLGPGGTRNHGLAECTGDYVLFLDDDVLPEPQIIREYWELVLKHPNAAGFIGRTVLPPPQTPRQFAVKYAGIAYFWDIASQTTRDLPWGITANLCVKRSNEVVFRPEIFVKGGGGEDVDFCIQLDKWYREHDKESRSFVPAPKATVHHPYWNNGECFVKQFFCWAKGDSTLMEVYPEKSFWSFPDFSESMALLILAQIALLTTDMVSLLTALIVLMTFAFAEVMYETICHLDLVLDWGLPFTWRVGAATCMIRTVSEVGRFYGQSERGTLFSKLFHRYNWFEDNLPEWPTLERTRALKRHAFRVGVVGLSLWVTQPLRG